MTINRTRSGCILAYRLQADRFGDLDADTLKILERVGGISQSDRLANELTALDRRRSTPQAGAVLVREWDRRSHHVMVTPDGFAWNGKTFESLSRLRSPALSGMDPCVYRKLKCDHSGDEVRPGWRLNE